jgi:hypothetical protein
MQLVHQQLQNHLRLNLKQRRNLTESVSKRTQIRADFGASKLAKLKGRAGGTNSHNPFVIQVGIPKTKPKAFKS